MLSELNYFYLAVPLMLCYAASASREPPGAYRTPTGTCYGDAGFTLHTVLSLFLVRFKLFLPEEPTSPDEEMLFINHLRKSIMYTYSDMDDKAKETALRLLDVLASTVGGMSSFFKQSPSCNGFVNECLTSSNPAIRDSAANRCIVLVESFLSSSV